MRMSAKPSLGHRISLVLLALSMAYCSRETTRPSPEVMAGNQPVAEPQSRPKVSFVVELDPQTEVRVGAVEGVQTVEAFTSADKTYAIYDAESVEVLTRYFEQLSISARKVMEVRDINSPVRGGGQPAGMQSREGHRTFVIERKIAGVGTFPDEKKAAISRKSNAAVAEIGRSIEWDRSYLTDEGTYCVYRATDEKTIRKHAAITGAPANTVSEVQTVVSPK